MLSTLSKETLDLLLVATSASTLLLAAACVFLWQRNKTLQADCEAERGIDPLTGTWNRVRFMELAEKQINHVQRTGRSAALMIIDLDHCQKINEQYGHHAGDLAVQYLARCAQSCVRDYDLLGRYSGEELAMLLPDTSQEGANAVASRLRDAIAEQQVVTPKNEKFLITVSIGLSVLVDEIHTLEDILLAADIALTSAKTQGHNRTVFQRV
ncbi:MAG: hypothetical protein H6R07_1769 [Proteobacteria bacterium]|nr:hypothetical protein [Pseudomonadota bacterium]